MAAVDAPMDAPRAEHSVAPAPRPAGTPSRPVVPAVVMLIGRAAPAGALVAGAATMRIGSLPTLVRVLPLVVAAVVVGVSVLARGRPGAVPAARIADLAGLVAAGVACGSAGHPEWAVTAAVPVAFVAGSEAGVRLGAAAGVIAAGAGVLTAAAAGRIRAGNGVAAAAITAAGVWVAWAGMEAARTAATALTERNEMRRLRTEMVTTVSHELRTPLTVIQGATATLTRRWDVLSEPERLDLIDVLTENVASLDASILHFADASRLERGAVVLKPEWVDVAAAIDTAARSRMAALAGHAIKRDLGIDRVWADKTSIERILEHLLMNAARFSAIGLPITVRTAFAGGDTTVAVIDHGQGIPPHLRKAIWEPLQRGDVAETGISRGAGLGLPIVRELARLHGGEASLTSVRGRGTTVWVTLPQPAIDPELIPRTRSGAPTR